MFLKFFKRPLPAVLFAVVLVGIILWIGSFIGVTSLPFQFENQTPLFTFINDFFKNYLFLNRLAAFSLMLLCSLFLIQINSKFILIKSRTYIPALLSIILCSSFLPLQGVNPAVISAFFLIISIDHIFSAYDVQRPYNNLFMAGFFTAVSSIFYIPSSSFLVLIFISILLLKTFNPREWIIALLGFATPWFFTFMYFYLVQDNVGAIQEIFLNSWLSDHHPVKFSMVSMAFLVYIGFLFIISAFYLIANLPVQKISVQKYHSILLWFSIITAVVYIAIPSTSIEVVYLAAIPLSFQFSVFFSYSRNRFWPEVFLIILFIFSVLMQFWGVS